jgi:hypothetical protein
VEDNLYAIPTPTAGQQISNSVTLGKDIIEDDETYFLRLTVIKDEPLYNET